MKRLRFLVVLVISIFIFNINVYAVSGSLSVSSSNVYAGDSFTVSVNINSAAAWNVHVSASGPVNNCEINEADVTEDAEDTSKTFSTICTATGEGTIVITLSGDVTSASDGVANPISNSKNITVSKKTSPSNSEGDNDNSNDDNNEDSNIVDDNKLDDDKNEINDSKQSVAVFTPGGKEDEEITVNSDTGDFTIIIVSFLAVLFLGFIMYFIIKRNKDNPNNK